MFRAAIQSRRNTGMDLYTPLYKKHLEAGARIVDFHGWRLPIEYGGILKEAKAVRASCGLFDISHMGEILISGEGRREFMLNMAVNDITLIARWQGQYNLFCNERGGVIDDFIVYNLGEEFLCVVNASNKDKDLEWLIKHKTQGVDISDVSAATSLIALQGPLSQRVLQDVSSSGSGGLSYMNCAKADISGREVLIARTGYTGEDGFEIFLNNDDVLPVWDELVKEGGKYDLRLCGLGARDVLRVEAGYPLYGNELNESIDPFQSSLRWVVKNKGEFIGKQALLKKSNTPRDKRVGFIMDERVPAKKGDAIYSLSGNLAGEVTSGVFSPNLGSFIGMAYLDNEFINTGDKFSVSVRGKLYPARIRKLPFVGIKTVNPVRELRSLTVLLDGGISAKGGSASG